MNLNIELFKRYKPENKLALINRATQSDLVNVSFDTILRMIKEAGIGRNPKQKRNKFKELNIARSDRAGNNWNSTVEGVYNWKNNTIYLDVYIQGDDTDTNCSYSLSDFLKNINRTSSLASIHEEFRDGYEQTKQANYTPADKANVIKSICITYIKDKYKI